MMATEPFDSKPADVPAAPEPRPVDQIHDAVPEPANVNGAPPVHAEDIANKRIALVEEQINSADVSVSGGSDTEASRTDWARPKDGDKNHGRAGSSVKKPTTFKAVSVNKTFLASKAAPTGAVTRANERPMPSSSTPPPGSSTLSASRPRLVAKSASGARDSSPRLLSAVNGAKPATAPDPSVVWNKNRPPEPKKFTDEELKRYGIHMASRLNEDDASGQNKWADIDDDDDDWAPEAITWGDGTKTTLPHPDEAATVASDNGSVASKGKSQEKPASPAPAAPTILPVPKPGAFASGRGLVLKAASQEKPALVTKPPPPPAPAKSPWATLPAIDRASPALAEAAHPGRAPFNAPSSYKAAPKEIAADDFSRSSWRDGPSHGNRELYNSHSGRYEPVQDRRGSMRAEVHPKHPALLQRPQPADQPAEPSSAFQTSRTSQDASFGRRRGSSNVSGGSGSYPQIMGRGGDGFVPPPPEIMGARRASLAGSTGSPVSSAASHAQPRQQPQQGWAPQSSPGSSFAAPASGPPPASGPSPPEAKPVPPVPVQPAIDEVEFQKKLMRERVELARKRRQEQEAREEAERKERIQKKLEALGPLPDKKGDKKEVVAKENAPKPTQIQQREPPKTPQAIVQASGQDAVPDADAKDSSTGRDAPGSGPKSTTPHVGPPSGPAARRQSHGQDGKRPDPWSGSGPRPDRFSSWAGGAPPPARNVWGSPDNDRGLGNGTFNPNLGRVTETTAAPPPAQKGPAPIAPPSAGRTPSQGQPQAQPPVPAGPQAARYGPTGSDLAQRWVTAVAENDKKMSAARLAERTARERQLAEQGLSLEDSQPTIKDTWRPVHLVGDGTRRTMGAVEVQSHGPGSWKGHQQRPGKSVDAVEDVTPSTNASVIGSGSSSILAQTGPGAPPQSRASRFFPNTKDIRQEIGTAMQPSRPASPTPPPPTMEGHPAYEGDVMRPHVSLPKPQPVVKLPPSMMGSQAPQHQAQAAWPSRAPGKESARAPSNQGQAPLKEGDNVRGSWQDRINNLLNGGKSSPPKLMGVDPASRNMLDHAAYLDPATVSLPSVAKEADELGFGPNLISKPMAEECFEEQEIGSLPQIRLPHKAPEAAWQPATIHTKPLPKRFLVQASVMEPYHFAADVIGGGNAVKIQFPGMGEAKIVTLPFAAARGSRSGHGRPSSRHRGSGTGSRGSKREPSNNYNGGEAGASGAGRGGRSAYRNRGADSWSRQTHSSSQSPAQSKVQTSLPA